MAVLALGFVGEAIGASIGGTLLGVSAASIGGFIGSTVGGLIDNMLNPVNQTGPRLTDLTVQSAAYGEALPRLWGPENRAAGKVIYSSGLIETVHTQHSGGLPGKGGPSVNSTTFTYSTNVAIALCDCAGPVPGRERPIQTVKKIWANTKLIYDSDPASGDSPGGIPQSANLWSSLAIYDGSMTQMPDPDLESVYGVGRVPAYRGTAYVKIWGLQLADYGNRLPNLEFLIEQDGVATVQAVLLDISSAAGIDPNSISSMSIPGTCRGYAIASNSSCTAALQPMALVWNFDTAEVCGQLRFAYRALAPRSTIDSRFLAAYENTGERPQLITWSRAPETGMPREASLTFADPDRDWQVNSQVARRSSGSAQSNLQSTVPIVLTSDEGRQVVDRLMWEAWNGRDTAATTVDDRLISLESGKVYVFETPAGLEPLRLTRRTRGANGVMQLALSRDRSQVYLSTATGVSAPAPVQTVNVPGPTTLMLLDCPILEDSDDDTGFYYLVDGQTASWRGADFKRSTDSGATFSEVDPIGFQTILGTIDDGLGDGPTAVFDMESVVRVVLDDPTDALSSLDELNVLNGGNPCWIGDEDGQDGEVAQFMTATLIAPGVYDLSGWLRGRLGTEHATGTHGSGQRFVLLSEDVIARVDFTPSDWNKDRQYKAVSLLTLEADTPAQDFTNTGEGKRPLSPVHVEAVKDSTTGDVAISWIRRSRLRQPGLGNGNVPLGESVESYEVDVYRGATFERTLTSSIPSVTYTAAQLVADGFSSGDTAILAVYQISDVRGRGRPANARIKV